MIIEPTGWGVECDRCETAPLRCDKARDESETLAAARKTGWIAPIQGIEYCSLNCLLVMRATEWGRDYLARLVREHMATHTDRCCRLHRTHATRGRHHWADCVDPKWAGVSVL